MITKRSPKERMAFYRGQKAAYDMLIKMWPISKEEIASFSKMVECLMESDMEKANDQT